MIWLRTDKKYQIYFFVSAKQKKREDIVKNFDEHLRTIKQSMEKDVSQSQEENKQLIAETADLENKYEDLKKECAEKIELMNTQMSE